MTRRLREGHEMTWYHGGVPGLKRGDKILPPSQTGAHSVADTDHPTELDDRLAKVYSRDVVYLTSLPAAARLFASMHPAHGGRNRGGDLYEVQPDGPVKPDPDYLKDDGASVCCGSATVVRVVGRRIPRPSGAALAALEAAEGSRR